MRLDPGQRAAGQGVAVAAAGEDGERVVLAGKGQAGGEKEAETAIDSKMQPNLKGSVPSIDSPKTFRPRSIGQLEDGPQKNPASVCRLVGLDPFLRAVAFPIFAGDKDHPGGDKRSEALSIVSGSARHTHV